MSFAKGFSNNIAEKKKDISDIDILQHYLGINKIPSKVCSPLRQENRPSFGLYTRDGKNIYYVDFAKGDRGTIVNLFMKLWGLSYDKTIEKIVNEVSSSTDNHINITKNCSIRTTTETKCKIDVKVRDWNTDDISYWNSYGISLSWLKFADVHPISHIIFHKDNKEPFAMRADKLAYVFVEFKENKVTYKIYQPYNTNNFKWLSTHDKSVISLWTKIPQSGEKLIICSSLKDALCLWINVGIPCIAPQGEGYSMSDTAINELKRRYQNIYILYDNDKWGIDDSNKLQKLTNFKNLQLPPFAGGKDVSDLYKIAGKQTFINTIQNLLKNE